MQGNRFTVSIHVHGTLAANATGMFAVPCDCSLVEVSFCNTGASDAILDVGAAADPDGFISDMTVGDSEVPNVFTYDEFNGELITAAQDVNNPTISPPHLTKGTVVEWLLDFDGAGGNAAANASILMTFLEG
jgi:hypothetical protein